MIECNKNNGFTLVELAIVIVIIGLLVGGVLQGQSLVEAAKNQNVIKSINQLQAARTTFKAKYNCLPGDCINAGTFFTGVPNGNGNGYVDYFWSSYLELTWVWYELVNSKIYRATPASSFCGPTLNFSSNGCFYASPPFDNDAVMYLCGECEALLFYGGTPTTDSVLFARWNGASGGTNDAGILSPERTYQIDQKIDDGNPFTGNFVAVDGKIDETATWLDCVTPLADSGASATSASTYNLSETRDACRFRYKL